MSKRHIFFSLLLFIVFINIFFFLVEPSELVESIGIRNIYLVVFVASAIGGISAVSGAALFAALIAFAAGGANPWILGLVSGVGIFISDSIFYHLALYGKKSLSKAWEEKTDRALSFVRNRSPRAVLGITYLYLGFTPLPADILMAVLALSGYSYKKITPILLAGSITVAILVSHLGSLFY